jgi:hypothetical protein
VPATATRFDSGARRARGYTAQRQYASSDSTAALLAEARRQSLRQKSLGYARPSVDTQQQLASVFATWTDVVRLRSSRRRISIFRSVATLLLYRFDRRAAACAGPSDTTSRLTMDRRRYAHAAHGRPRPLAVLGILLILLVIFGPPSNLGTFLGLVGAGLTVALQDFIVAFIGWFVLMGADGIRPGDLGRDQRRDGRGRGARHVPDSVARDGCGRRREPPHRPARDVQQQLRHPRALLQFSTTGQWLLDDSPDRVPESRDPYPISEALRGEVEAATAESAREAEADGRLPRAPHFATLAATPRVNLRPIPGGAEITVRYVTRLSERAEMRARLYRTAMEQLAAAAPR